ncbi:AfsR/SARP family transcriptional regulator [Catenulispora pinisilvae]|uniref:AfsR/SARP family transcriptional regulator n=1 Tax=Catenulispora pinisilvae TaxID=2705253 RepID=UPI001891F42E|nr:BTAD domain-containing putative transcriptional regulator [Catenulispora pinisilvae]
MWFGVLGPTTVLDDDGAEVALGRGIPRTVLTTLLASANRAVSADRLASAVWGDERPRSAEASLRNHMARLRQWLGAAVGGRIRTAYPGYRIDVRDGELDEQVFDVRSRLGHRALASGDWATAAAELAGALTLWRGDPYADLAAGAWSRPYIQQLEESRMLAWQARIDADLHLGRHRGVVPELFALTAEHPVREALHAQLMLALYRSGRQGEAQDVFLALRRSLVDELAVEPSAEVCDLHRRIISNDPALEAEAGPDVIGTVEPSAPSWSPPAPPPRTSHFGGRGPGDVRRFNILGPLLIEDGAREVRLDGPRHSKVLAALLLEPNRVVELRRLTEAMWDGEQPATAVRQVRDAVSALRRALGAQASAAGLISTHEQGYRINLRTDELDLLEFEHHMHDAQRSSADGGEGAGQERIAALRAALGCWRAPALAGIASAALANSAALLDERRLWAQHEVIDLELGRRRHREVVSELRGLIRLHPFDEWLVRQGMLALYRCSRRAEALTLYRELRTRLVQELGVEPGHEVRELRQRILGDDEGLMVPDASGPAADTGPAADAPDREQSRTRERRESDPPATGPLAQLPADVADFCGRERETVEVLRVLRDEYGGPGRVPVAVVIGGGGLGKTALAVHAAHLAARDFPDGQLFVDLRGAGSAAGRDPGDVLASFLGAFGVPSGELPPDVEERAARFRAVLGGRRVLIVLDNALDPAQVRPLIPPAGCAVLVTSRGQLSGLAGGHRLDLELLPSPDALSLLERIVGTDRTGSEPVAVASILDSCAGLPLALRIAGARLAERPSRTLAWFAQLLADRRRRLDELSVSDLAVRACFELSYAQLPGSAPPAGDRLGVDVARVFRVAALTPAVIFDVAEVAALLGEGYASADVEAALERLVDVHLIADHGDGRYAFHDLVRSYALRLLEEADVGDESGAASRRLFSWYAIGLDEVTEALEGRRSVLDIGPEPGTPPLPGFSDRHAAVAWCARYAQALSGAIDKAPAVGRPDLAGFIAVEAMAYVLADMTVDWRDWLQRALRAQLGREDKRMEAWLRHRLGVCHGMWERAEQCVTELERALDLHRVCGDRLGETIVLHNLSNGYALLKQFDKALEHGRLALAYLAEQPELGANTARKARIHTAVADAYLNLHDYEGAIRHYQRAIELLPPGSRDVVISLNNLGDTYRALGRFREAVASITDSLRLATVLGDRYLQADAQHTLGRAFAHFDRPAGARTCWQQSLAVFQEIDFAPGIERVLASLSGLEQ